jgi:hypothetical protein
MPVLASRLATPTPMVDPRWLPDDAIRLGALVRWRDIEDDQRRSRA